MAEIIISILTNSTSIVLNTDMRSNMSCAIFIFPVYSVYMIVQVKSNDSFNIHFLDYVCTQSVWSNMYPFSTTRIVDIVISLWTNKISWDLSSDEIG